MTDLRYIVLKHLNNYINVSERTEENIFFTYVIPVCFTNT